MITVAMIAYNLVAFGLIYCVAYFTYRANARRSQALVDKLVAEMWAKYGHTPTLEPYVPKPLPELPPPPELRVTIAWHPESDLDQIARGAAKVVQRINQRERDLGGEGLDHDIVEEPGRLVLRLTPRSADWEAAGRLVEVAEEFNQAMRRSKQDAVAKDAADIRAKVERELQPRLPPEVAEYVVAAVVS